MLAKLSQVITGPDQEEPESLNPLHQSVRQIPTMSLVAQMGLCAEPTSTDSAGPRDENSSE